MDILVLILGCFWVSKQAKIKGLPHKQWVWQFIGLFILFEITGGLISLSLTKSLVMASLFGFVCAVGALLLIKYRLDNIQNSNPEHLD
jgi:hypothetical protein